MVYYNPQTYNHLYTLNNQAFSCSCEMYLRPNDFNHTKIRGEILDHWSKIPKAFDGFGGIICRSFVDITKQRINQSIRGHYMTPTQTMHQIIFGKSFKTTIDLYTSALFHSAQNGSHFMIPDPFFAKCTFLHHGSPTHPSSVKRRWSPFT